MIYLKMFVSNNTLLNILVPETNKVLKEVLKEADVKTLLSQNKDLNISNVFKSLFKDISSDKSSNETILKMLKNTNIAKDLGSFSSNLKSLLKSLPDDKATLPLKTFLQNFLVNIDKAGSTNIKEQFEKSGVFLESKLEQQIKNPTSKTQNSILNDMKTVLLKTQAQLQNQVETKTAIKIPVQQTLQSQQASQIQESTQNTQAKTSEKVTETLKQIDKILTQVTKLESSTSPILKSDTSLLNEIKTILSKVQEQLQGQVKQNTTSSTSQLFQMKAQIQEQISNTQQNIKEPTSKELLKQIDTLLAKITKEQPSNTSAKVTQQINPNIIKNEPPLLNDIKTILLKTQTELQSKLQIQSSLQEEIQTQIKNSKDSDPNDVLKQIDKLLTQIDYHQLYSLANSSNNIYVPFLWDLLEDGYIDIKKSEHDKFYCIIDLTLKNLGKLDIHLFMLNQENLDISIFVEQDDTKQLIRKKLSNLKQALYNTDLKIQSINIFSRKSDKSDLKENIYKETSNFDFGVNIKV